MLRKFILLYNTLKYLKFSQILWRFIYFLPRFQSEVSTCPDTINSKTFVKFICRNGITTDYISFTFLNETFSIEKVGWTNISISELWNYNLHYFDYLLQEPYTSQDLEKQKKIIESWIINNSYGKGIGWDPYPTSLRIINWIKWHSKTGGLTSSAKLSLWNQVLWLAKRPEYHLLGNHLFMNGKALLFASAFFHQNENSKIYKVGIKIINSELDEQFLSDGGHFELSPMYHSLAMEDLLDLISISHILPFSFPKKLIENKFKNGMRWLKSMIYDNYELSHFNDCANGIAPNYIKLKELATLNNLFINDNINTKYLFHKETGFIIFEDARVKVIADVGKVGPDYLPGHAHADSLSFEFAVNGQRVIVNSGTSLYGLSPERIRQRGTAAHSTIEIDKTNSSEIWSGFRVARRAKPFNISFDSCNYEFSSIFKFSASHDGYVRLNKNIIHSRTWILKHGNLEVEDELTGDERQVCAYFYLHPDINLVQDGSNIQFFKDENYLADVKFDFIGQIEINKTTYHDKFGTSKENKCIVLKSKSPCSIKTKFEVK